MISSVPQDLKKYILFNLMNRPGVGGRKEKSYFSLFTLSLSFRPYLLLSLLLGSIGFMLIAIASYDIVKQQWSSLLTTIKMAGIRKGK